MFWFIFLFLFIFSSFIYFFFNKLIECLGREFKANNQENLLQIKQKKKLERNVERREIKVKSKL